MEKEYWVLVIDLILIHTQIHRTILFAIVEIVCTYSPAIDTTTAAAAATAITLLVYRLGGCRWCGARKKMCCLPL